MYRKWFTFVFLLPLTGTWCSVQGQALTPPAAAKPADEEPKLGLGLGLPPSEARQIVIVSLKNLDCESALSMLNSLLQGEELNDVNTAVDGRTNSIILRGKKSHVDEFLAILEKLDKESPKAPPRSASATATRSPNVYNPNLSLPSPVPVPQPQVAATTMPPTASPLYRTATLPNGLEVRYIQQQSILDPKLAQEYSKLEEQALQAARELRSGAPAEKPNEKQLEQSRKKLADLVARAFDKRQEVQQQEVKQLKERLEKVQASLSKRDSHRQEIIDKRVAELLDEDRDLRWDIVAAPSHSYAVAPQLQTVEVNPVVPPTQRFYDYHDQAPSSFRPAIRTPVPVSPAPTAFRSLPPPVPVEPGVSAPQGTPVFNSNVGLMKAEDELAEAESRVKQKKAQRDYIRRELETQLRILELDVQAAQARVESAKSNLEEMMDTKRRAPGTFGPADVRKVKGEADQAEYQLEKAKALLELQRSSLTPSPSKDEPKPKTANK
jgi:hypothetical protein